MRSFLSVLYLSQCLILKHLIFQSCLLGCANLQPNVYEICTTNNPKMNNLQSTLSIDQTIDMPNMKTFRTLLFTFFRPMFEKFFLNAKTNKYLPNVSKEAVLDQLHAVTRLTDDFKIASFEQDKKIQHKPIS